MNKKLKIKLREIAEAMIDGSVEVSYYIDTQTNEIFPVSPFFEDDKEI